MIPFLPTMVAAVSAPISAQTVLIADILAVKPRDRQVKKKPVIVPPNTAKANILTGVTVQTDQGNVSAESDRVLKAITAKVGQPLSQEQIQKDLKAIQDLGIFQNVRVQPTATPQGTKLTYIVTSFSVLRQVSIKTLPDNKPGVIPAADVDALFKSQYGQPLNPTALKESIAKLNALYKEKGYELAQIVDVENPTADGQLTLVVAEGLIEDIQVRFLDKDRKPLVDTKGQPLKGTTRDYIITREVELKPGNVYNRKTIEKDLRRIFRLGLFEDLGLSFSSSAKNPSQVIVQINVVETNRNSKINASGTVGGSNGLAALLGYTQSNLGGNNQNLGGEVQIGRDLLFNLSYGDPWIGGDPNRTSYNISAFSSRSLPLAFEGGTTPIFLPGGTESPRINRTGGGITFGRPLSGNPYEEGGWLASAGLNYQKVGVMNSSGQNVPLDAANNPLTLSGTGEDDLFTARLGLSKDTRDSPLQPSQGSLVRFGVDQAIPIGLGNISTTKLTGSYTQYVPISLLNFDKGPQAIALNIQGGTALGTIAPYEAFNLGGVSSVRGYEEGGLATGKSYVRASAEYQFPIISFLGGSLFADYGSDLGTASEVPGNPGGSRGKPGSGFGYGAGLRLNVGIPLQLNYGLNDRGEQRFQFGLSVQQ
jgi:outer membrane protein insertion porin family